MVNLIDVDTCSEDNTDGLHRMAVDSVLALLREHRGLGHDSYLTRTA